MMVSFPYESNRNKKTGDFPALKIIIDDEN
jgi:hypothetical protein